MSTTPQYILNEIQEPKAKKSKKLDLYGRKLDKVSEEVFELDHLEVESVNQPTATSDTNSEEPAIAESSSDEVDGTGAAGMPITTEEGAGDNSLAGFEETLKEAVVTQNYQLMMLTMDDPFGFDFWRSEGYPASPNEAVDTLRTNYILPESHITFPDPPPDLTALLGGIDPLSMWEPSVNVVSALYSTGWGADGKGDAMLIIAQHPDGYYYWYSVLIAPSLLKGQ